MNIDKAGVLQVLPQALGGRWVKTSFRERFLDDIKVHLKSRALRNSIVVRVYPCTALYKLSISSGSSMPVMDVGIKISHQISAVVNVLEYLIHISRPILDRLGEIPGMNEVKMILPRGPLLVPIAVCRE
jgi:hypothetical protein